MDLLPEELRKTLPPLYSQETSSAPVVHAKFFTPDAGWTWVFFYRSRETVKLGCCKILLDKIPSFGYSMVDESIRRPTGT
jgi:hypothetical protein